MIATERGEDPSPVLLRAVLLVLVGIAVILGLYLRVRLRTVGSFWLDELWTTDAVSRSLREMVGERLVSDQSPPLWTLSVWAWLRVVGTYSTPVMRIWPVIWGGVAVGAFLFGAWRLRQLRLPFLLVAAGLSLSLRAIDYSVELRPYAMAIALSSISTVIWAGLLAGQIRIRGATIFLFCLAGALGGFAHYYGNLAYLAESVVLVTYWLVRRQFRGARLASAWVLASLAPVVAWIVLTGRWFPNLAVAPPPSLGIIRAWLTESFDPLPRAIDGGSGWWSSGWAPVTLIVVASAWSVVRVIRDDLFRDPSKNPAAIVSAAAFVAVVVALSGAWIVSVTRPPSLNGRNCTVFLPPLFVGLAGAATSARHMRLRYVAASVAVASLIAGMALVWSRWGIEELAPFWQRDSGYREASSTLLEYANREPTTRFFGLEAPWNWHGDWDASMRSVLGSSPAISSDPPPLAITWVGPSGIDLASLPSQTPIVVITAYDSEPFDSLVAAIESVAGRAWAGSSVDPVSA